MLDRAPDIRPERQGRVGPNAILQLEAPVRDALGAAAFQELLDIAAVELPTGDQMISEGDAACVHQTLNRLFPDASHQIRIAAGAGTGAYIRANRIPGFAQVLLRVAPTFLAERMLTRAILLHAWTFCGSGSVSADRKRRTIVFSIAENPLTDRSSGSDLQCDWHVAVFHDLFNSLLRPDYQVEETACCGSGAPACRIRITRL